MNQELVKLQVSIPSELKGALAYYTASRGGTMSAIVTEALNDWFQKREIVVESRYLTDRGQDPADFLEPDYEDPFDHGNYAHEPNCQCEEEQK